jgi:hypothetical protein
MVRDASLLTHEGGSKAAAAERCKIDSDQQLERRG